MKKRLLVVLIAAIAAALLWTAGYLFLGGSFAVKNPAAIYATAITDSALGEDLILTVTEINEITTKNETYTSRSQQIIRYDTDNGDTPIIQKEELLQIGSHKVSFTETFSGEQLYTTIDDVNFVSNESSENYQKQCLPPVIIDAERYEDISGIRNTKQYILTFADATAPEQWLIETTPDLFSAEGTAYINLQGQLTESDYVATYSVDDIQYRTTVNVVISRENTNISLPENAEEYRKISNANALRQLEITCGYLMQAEKISSLYQDNIYVQATGDRRSQSISASAKSDKDWSACIETAITLSNDSRSNYATTQKKTENYTEGKYTVQFNNDPLAQDAQISEENMRKYLHNHLVSTIMLPQYIDSISVNTKDDLLTISFTGNQAFAEFLTGNACDILYKDPELIQKTANNFKTQKLDCFIMLSKSTGLAVASGIAFSAEYDTLGLPYLFEYQATQTYQIG